MNTFLLIPNISKISSSNIEMNFILSSENDNKKITHKCCLCCKFIPKYSIHNEK